MNMKRHPPGVIRDPLRLHLVHVGKSKDQPFWRAAHRCVLQKNKFFPGRWQLMAEQGNCREIIVTWPKYHVVGRWYTGRKICQIWAEWAVYVDCHLQKGWFSGFPICTRWSLNGSRMTLAGWRFMFIFFWWIILSNEVCTMSWSTSRFPKTGNWK